MDQQRKRAVANLSGDSKRHTAQKRDGAMGLVFEDPFGDDMEDEEMVTSDGDEATMDGDAAITDKDIDMDDDEQVDSKMKKVFMPGVDKLQEDEMLDYDSSAYDMYYALTAEWPALSIDVVRDSLGAVRSRFPMTIFMVAGTQASNPDDNQVTVMKMSELYKTKNNDASDSEDDGKDDEDETDGDPVLETRSIPHSGGVNRIRCMPQVPNIVATWSDRKKVHLWDISKQLESLDGKVGGPLPTKQMPVYSFTGHTDEGFAMDWSPVEAGRLVTGDCSKFIYLWASSDGGWSIDKVPFVRHKSSVEDLQWSPTEASVFASCSSDRSVRIWDVRRKAGSMLDITAHDDDVNVITWNRNVAYLLASGSDDGSFKIWDLRNFKADNPVAHFRYHTAPITSIEWHPTDESVLAVSGADNQISVWDMSVEEDAEAAVTVQGEKDNRKLDLPPQLLFIHQGQTDIKELHFHPQCPGVLMSTAGDGYNVFKPANIS
ncbi:glutamate-rich wd repeat-containing protein 1 [Plasmopara halstedii]|uniref:Glutamate-rich WD repeat-containing protein 1 n=1 Tax=Plasmopara halstedii TaxID=4781 RepID=A0A0P1AE81_PLAHL|nr:glutamate-rich wd repeat-containing protein 1 [Plasmopara halstedii]CEG39257.1 glutamate-rich wd repeat-containing protein 1 [Plasmopara halstedii]|eukprot:XP_024575626.1 glutamate-rich wd repeat-containing protein 1 [Plasmopara halstedii]